MLENGNPVLAKDPTVLSAVNILQYTLEFNKHPGPEAFTLKYKPGTPVSDRLRQMTYEFGQQKIGAKPTRAEAETMLNEQIAQAGAQKKTLDASAALGGDWSSWAVWGFGGFALIASLGLWAHRRRS